MNNKNACLSLRVFRILRIQNFVIQIYETFEPEAFLDG